MNTSPKNYCIQGHEHENVSNYNTSEIDIYVPHF